MFKRKDTFAVLLIAMLCVGVSLGSATMAGAPHSLSDAAESMAVGGSNCSDFLDGAAVGLGIGVLFGCVWCAVGAIGAKAIGLFC